MDKLTPDPATVKLLEVLAESEIDREAIGWDAETLVEMAGDTSAA